MGVLLYFNFFKFTVIIELIHSGSSRDIFRHTFDTNLNICQFMIGLYHLYDRTITGTNSPFENLSICDFMLVSPDFFFCFSMVCG